MCENGLYAWLFLTVALAGQISFCPVGDSKAVKMSKSAVICQQTYKLREFNMQESRGIISSQHGRIEALQARRAILKDKIREELKRPSTSSELIRKLKLENLKLKDEIEGEIKSA